MIGKIQYGAIELDVTKVNDVRRTPLYSDDGVDYLCTETIVDVMCVLNPAATSFASIANLVPQAGEAFAGRTDRVLFDYLSNASDRNGLRKTFKMFAYDQTGQRVVYLESPQPSQGRGGPLRSDFKNGPKCYVFSVNGADVHGAKCWVLHLAFITWINNCLDGTSPIVSHRWDRTVDYDGQYRANSTTRGTVVFNVGRLWQNQFSPDYFRSQFFQPPPDNMRRQAVNVQIASDNCTAHYTVVDSEQFASLGTNSPATNVEATLQTWYTQGSATAALARTAPVVWSAMAESLANPASPFANARRAAGVFEAFAGNLQAQLPTYYTNVRVRAHGARNSSRMDLANLCFSIAFSRLGDPSFYSLANRAEMIVSQSLTDNFVDLSMTLRFMDQIFTQLAGIVGPPGAIVASLGLLVANDNGRRFLDSYFRNQNAADDPTGNNTYTRPPDAPLPQNFAGELLQQLQNVAGAAANARAAITNPPNFQPGAPLLSNKPIGNRPMNTVNPGATHNRGIGYMRFLITQGLLGQCVDPISLPNAWDTDAGGGGAPGVTPVNVPLLPNA